MAIYNGKRVVKQNFKLHNPKEKFNQLSENRISFVVACPYASENHQNVKHLFSAKFGNENSF